MNIVDTITTMQSQLKEIEAKEEQNQQEQAAINQSIQELEQELQQKYQRQSELDREAIELYRQTEELKTKLAKLEKIANFYQQFQELEAECQDNQELLHTLYSSLSITKAQDTLTGAIAQSSTSDTDNHRDREYSPIKIEQIKAALPNAERIYQQILAHYLEQYQIYQNLIVDELDLIWCSLAFVTFGRSSYRKLSLKYHPDLAGSDHAMKLINTAWEISQDYLSRINATA